MDWNGGMDCGIFARFNQHGISQVSLITGLEYGLEWWNGLWNFCVQQTAPFHTVF